MRKLIYIEGQIYELEKLRVVPNIEWTNNSNIANFKLNFVFSNFLKSRNLLIFPFGQFQKFLIGQSSKNFQFWILKIRKIRNLESSKSFQYAKLQKFSIFYNFKNRQIQKIVQFRKIAHLQYCTISKNSKNFQFSNFKKF